MNIAHNDCNKTGSTLPKFGKRDTESGRLYIVLAFQKSFHFGGQSDDEINSKRERLLRIVQNPENNFPLRIYTATFNAGNTVLVKIKDSFSQWLPINKQIDLYVIGFQELHTKISKSHSTHNLSTGDIMNEQKSDSDEPTPVVYGTKLAALDGINALEVESSMDSLGVANEDIVDSQLMMSDEERMLFELDLNQQKEMEYHFMTYFGEEYEMIGSYKMWQTRLFVVTKKKYLDQISDVTKHFHRTGIGGVGKNKGAVGISFDFDGISLCFVCSHLAAHQTQSKARNAQYRKICHNLRVGWPKQQLLGQFHHLFWLGDLNYRVNVNGLKQQDTPSDNTWILYMNDLQLVINGKNGNPNGYCKSKRKSGEVVYGKFLDDDQLIIAQQNDDVFVGFEEQNITFPPTFKVERESGLSYVQQRLPAWTDRILIRSATGFQNKCLYYRSYPAVSISDHKPVAAEFVIGNWHRSGCLNDICVKCEVQFRNMSAVDLIAADVNGKSDPFLHFPRQLLLEKYVKFDKCKKTLNPKWKNSHLKVLPLIRNSLEFLEKALLLFQVRDWDRFTGNDLIACGFLPLYPIACDMNSWKNFDVSLTLDGLKAGQIHGEFKLVYRM